MILHQSAGGRGFPGHKPLEKNKHLLAQVKVDGFLTLNVFRVVAQVTRLRSCCQRFGELLGARQKANEGLSTDLVGIASSATSNVPIHTIATAGKCCEIGHRMQ